MPAQVRSINTTSNGASQSKRPFASLQGEALAQLNTLGMEINYSRGGTVFNQGDAPQCVFLVLSGRIKLSVSSREGKTMILRIATAGDVLGLSAALNGAEHEVTAEALDNCQLKAIRVKDFLGFLQKYPQAAMEATRCTLQEYKAVFNDMRRLALPATVAGRLADLLLEWLDARFQSGHTEKRVIVALTQEEIAGMTGTSRETVSRVLQQFQRDKFICMKGSSLTVLRPDALEQLAV